MEKVEFIIGKPGEGKTAEMLKKYVEFCNGTTEVKGQVCENKSLLKPVFIYRNNIMEELYERISKLGYNPIDDLFINIETESEKLLDLWVNTISDVKQDVMLFLDLNMPLYNTPEYLATMLNDITPAIKQGVKVNTIITVENPYA